MPGTTTYTVSDGIAVIRLSAPPLNVVSAPLTASLSRDLSAAADDPLVRAVILTGDGNRAFCAGSDIGEFDELMSPGQVVDKKLRYQNQVFDFLESISKPTVAALNGLAFGGGLEIAMCCDVIVADESISVALPENNLGVFPSSGGPVRLTRRVGPGRAKMLILSREPISATEAERIGIIDRLAPAGQALALAQELATKFSRGPAVGIAAVKDLINRAEDESWADLKKDSFAWSDAAFGSADCAEGVLAFRQKRQPQFHASSPARTVSRSVLRSPDSCPAAE